MGAPGKGRLESWIPRHSIVGRIVHPLFEERKTLAGRMSWIGLGLLVAFLIVALGANVLAPFDPILPTDAIHVPPWTVATVPRNETYSGWTGNWSLVAEGQRIDGKGMVSNATGQVEQLVSFPLDVKRDAVVSVGMLVVVLGNRTDPGQYLVIEASGDAGATWFPPIPVRTVDRLDRIDLTGLTSWHAADLTRDTLTIRIIHASDAGTGNLTLDYVGATAEWQSFWHLMGTDAIGRDVFSRVLYGTRTSLVIMVIAVTVAFFAGFPIGLYSGYRGGTLVHGPRPERRHPRLGTRPLCRGGSDRQRHLVVVRLPGPGHRAPDDRPELPRRGTE